MNENELIDSLPLDGEEAFPIYENYMRETFLNPYNWQNGYDATEHRKDYICRMIGFIQIHNMDLGISPDIPNDSDDFEKFFSQADKKITILSTRLKLANSQKKKQASTPYYVLEKAKKTEIQHHINQIRTLIEQAELSVSKKETLFIRLNALSLEVDKDRSRGETILGIFTILTKSAGEGMDKINQALTHTHRIMEAYAKSDEAPLIQITFNNKLAIEAPRPQIENPNKPDEMADDIPF